MLWLTLSASAAICGPPTVVRVASAASQDRSLANAIMLAMDPQMLRILSEESAKMEEQLRREDAERHLERQERHRVNKELQRDASPPFKRAPSSSPSSPSDPRASEASVKIVA